MSRTALLSALVLLCSAWSASPVRADGPAALELVVAPCLASIEASLREILVIELDTQARIDDQTRDATLRASLSCRGNTVLMRVERLGSTEVLEDRVAGPSPGVLPTARTVALVLSELVGATRPDEPVVTPEPEAPPSPRRHEGIPIPPWLLDAGVVLRFRSGGGPLMGGLHAGVSHTLHPIVRLSGGAEWLSGAGGTTLGRVRATSLSLDGAAGIGLPFDNAWVGLDLGLRLGVMLWRGGDAENVAGARVAKPAFGLFGRVVGELGITERLRLRAALEVGATLVGSEATAIDTSGGEPIVVDGLSADRFWCTLAIGVSLAL